MAASSHSSGRNGVRSSSHVSRLTIAMPFLRRERSLPEKFVLSFLLVLQFTILLFALLAGVSRHWGLHFTRFETSRRPLPHDSFQTMAPENEERPHEAAFSSRLHWQIRRRRGTFRGPLEPLLGQLVILWVNLESGYLRLFKRAILAVVPEPLMGSRTTSPSADHDTMRSLASRSTIGAG